MNALPVAIAYERNERLLWCNPACRALLGCPPGPLAGSSLASIIAEPERLQELRKEGLAKAASGEAYSRDLLLRRSDGHLIWVNAVVRVLDSSYPECGQLIVMTDVTERRKTEEALRKSESRLDAAQAQARIGSWEDGPNRYWSKQMFALYGFEPSEQPPPIEQMLAQLHPDDVPKLRAVGRRAAETGLQNRCEYRSHPALGPTRYFEMTVRAEFDEVSRVWRSMGTTQDITERKQAEESLRQVHSRLEAAQLHARFGSWEISSDFRFRYWSRQMYVLFDFDPEAPPPSIDEFLLRVHPEDRALLMSVHREVVETQESKRFVYRGQFGDGTVRYFEVNIVPKLDPDGEVIAISGTSQDVTERKETEDALKLSESRLERAQAQAKIGNWEYEHSTGKTFWSKQLFALYDLDPARGVPSREAAVGFAHPDDRERLVSSLEQCVVERQPVQLTFRVIRGDGELRYLELNVVPEFDAEGRFTRHTGTIQDVTERERSAQALRESEQRLQRLLQNSSDLIVVVDVNGLIRSVRGPIHAMLGYEAGDIEGRVRFDLLHPDDVSVVRELLISTTGRPGESCRAEIRFRHQLNHYVDVEVVAINWLDDPIIQGIVINVRQISERKSMEQKQAKLQQQLEQASKMEAIGRLAGGVAHDFNNLLTVIVGNVELATSDVASNEALVHYLADIAGAAASATSLTRQLLAFSRRQLVEPKVVSLNELLGKLEHMLTRLIGEDIVLEMRLAKDLGAVKIDPGQFDQVLVNLIVNARDALPRGGRVTIETANVELDDAYCRERGDLRPGHFVRLSVTDNGEGMGPTVLAHIFEPFFTTKATGNGTGLGLAVTFGAVKQAGGAIEVYSELGYGTMFKIYLPRVDGPAQAFHGEQPARDVIGGTEKILLVEDNARVRELTAVMLERLGYRLLIADSGRTALTQLEAEHPAIDLLLTDLVMPEMSGRELGERFSALYPNAAVLYCSGYTEDAFVRHGLATENLQFLGKPFTLQQLASKLRQLFDERANSVVALRT